MRFGLYVLGRFALWCFWLITSPIWLTLGALAIIVAAYVIVIGDWLRKLRAEWRATQ